MGSLMSPHPALTQEGINSSSITSCHMPSAGRSPAPGWGHSCSWQREGWPEGHPIPPALPLQGPPHRAATAPGGHPGVQAVPVGTSLSLPWEHRPQPSTGTELRWLDHAHPTNMGFLCPIGTHCQFQVLPWRLKGHFQPQSRAKRGICAHFPPPLPAVIPCTPWAEMVTAVWGGSKNTRALTVTAAARPGGPTAGAASPVSPPCRDSSWLFPRTHCSVSGTPGVPSCCPAVPAGRCHGAVAACPPCPRCPRGLAAGTRPWWPGGCGSGCPQASPKPLIHLSQQEMPKLPFHAGSSARGLARSQCRRWQEMCPTSSGDPPPPARSRCA